MSEPPALTDREMIAIARALGDPRRFQMLREIAEAGSLCCQDMRAVHPVSAATVSYHVRELEMAALVEIVREGKFARLRFRAETMRAYRARLSAVFGEPLEGGNV